MIKELIYIITLFIGIPVGLVLSNFCSDEIKKWRKRMVIISIICLIIALILVFVNFIYKIPVIITLIFIAITDFTILCKSYEKKT